MGDPGSTTIALQRMLDRFAAGDENAREALIGQAMDRLMIIARKLLRGFGGEGRVEMWTSDVLNEAYPRLAKALDDVKPSSPVQFFGLARLQMQRALLDRVRANEGREGEAKPRPRAFSQKNLRADEPEHPHDVASPDGSRHRELMIDLLDAIARLPEKEAETVWLKLAGYTHAEIGEIGGLSKDRVDGLWNKACIKLAKPLAPFLGNR